MRSNSYLPGIILIVLGTYFLLEKHHLIPELGPLIHEWWPVALIVVGVLMVVGRARR